MNSNAVSPAVCAAIDSRASIDVRAVALPRASWETAPSPAGRAFLPEKGTWYGHVVRGKASHAVVVVPMIGCPGCGGLLLLSHTRETARAISKMHGRVRVPVAHRIDSLGKVSPDLRCQHPGCRFHRAVYLDRWNKTKPLFALAYTRGPHGRIEIAYSHAIDAREARFHLGAGDYRVIAAGRAVGLFVDDKTGRVTAD